MVGDEEIQMFILAYQLARSGTFRNATGIVAELRKRGFQNVRAIARDTWVKTRLTTLCAEARRIRVSTGGTKNQ